MKRQTLFSTLRHLLSFFPHLKHPKQASWYMPPGASTVFPDNGLAHLAQQGCVSSIFAFFAGGEVTGLSVLPVTGAGRFAVCEAPPDELGTVDSILIVPRPEAFAFPVLKK